MGIIIFLLVLFIFTVGSIKVAANLMKIDGATIGTCFIAVILSIVANGIAGAFLGEGLIASIVALILTGAFFGWLFKTSTLTGFVLALISIAVQFGFVLLAGALGFALLG
ncbi:hypothetical protein ACR30L_03630 [Psychromonas sp. PT13]|uniref:hypothetical protein n=1 Tax=Psychromonas sp. PT13 TaxID=3439547 RepID=UPI003EB841F2